MTTPEIERLAGALPKGARAACLAMTDEWQFPGRNTFNANGAWSLHWARGMGGRGALAEMQARPHGKHKRYAYRLTPLGLSLREYLKGQDNA